MVGFGELPRSVKTFNLRVISVAVPENGQIICSEVINIFKFTSLLMNIYQLASK